MFAQQTCGSEQSERMSSLPMTCYIIQITHNTKAPTLLHRCFGAGNQNSTDDPMFAQQTCGSEQSERMSSLPMTCYIIQITHNTKAPTLLHRCFGAGNQNRTDDLVITNDVLYRLSHTSMPLCDDLCIISNKIVFVKSF